MQSLNFRSMAFRCGAALLLQASLAAGAWAHHPELTAEAVCDEATGQAVLNYTATSWLSESPRGENSQIDVLVNDVVIGSGAFEDPTYSFSGSTALPSAAPGDTVVVTALAVGNWGDGDGGGQSFSVSVTVPALDCARPLGTGRFTGGGHQITANGVRVTRGLTIHCDLLLSNNLEINWNGNRFHMTEHMRTIACTDDPAIAQQPPRAPLDTLIGIGTGRYNGEDGYSIRFTLVDAGEPGAGVDKMQILIWKEGVGTVLDVPLQTLTGGNLQAHYDQPHR